MDLPILPAGHSNSVLRFGLQMEVRVSVSPSLLLVAVRWLGVFALLVPLFAERPSLSPHCFVGANCSLYYLRKFLLVTCSGDA